MRTKRQGQKQKAQGVVINVTVENGGVLYLNRGNKHPGAHIRVNGGPAHITKEANIQGVTPMINSPAWAEEADTVYQKMEAHDKMLDRALEALRQVIHTCTIINIDKGAAWAAIRNANRAFEEINEERGDKK